MRFDTKHANDEWLEADGLGGFVSGTVSGVRTRRYHCVLMCATRPPTGRMVLVNGLEIWVETPTGRLPLSVQRYTPDVTHPNGHEQLLEFDVEPWPTWTFRVTNELRIRQELFVPHGNSETVLRWSADGPGGGTLIVRPLLSGRDYHALHRENSSFNFESQLQDGYVKWQPYSGVPAIFAFHNGAYTFSPEWYRNFQYDEERNRGLDYVEDLASPGEFRWDLSQGDAVLVMRAASDTSSMGTDQHIEEYVRALRDRERRRRESFPTTIERAADAYVVQRGQGRTIVAGYPWFTDWGRDTFIALRGLSLATGRFDAAASILLEWADTISDGMLPNRFPDGGESPEYNSVDASLWYVVCVHDLLAHEDTIIGWSRGERLRLQQAVLAIVEGYADGTRYGIHMDTDGLLAAGVPGVQLTWMDAKIGDWVVTPRIGKPVEVQALWLNALRFAEQIDPLWSAVFRRGLTTFRERFWREDAGCLFDVIDVDHERGNMDRSMRPNQIFAIGGLPYMLLPLDRGRRIVDAVERTLLTPLGLRSLAPSEPSYRPSYVGGVRERDSAYHQGTVWPWLMGPFVEAWLRMHGSSVEVRKKAQDQFLKPFMDHLNTAGLGHVSEILDGEPPHVPRGCPFQAWSLGELLRIQNMLAVDSSEDRRRSVTRSVEEHLIP